MLIKRILCGEDAILNNVDQSEAELARLGGVAGAPAKGETRAERATTTSCSNANYPYIMPYRKPPPLPSLTATLRTSDHPFLPLRLESDVPSKFGFPISSIFLGSYLSIYIYSRMMAKDEYIRIDSNFPITILDRLLSQISKQASKRARIYNI